MWRRLALVLLACGCGDDDGGAADAPPSVDGPASPDGPPGADAGVDVVPPPDASLDACGGAPFPFVAPGAPVTGSTVGASDTSEGTCGGTSAGEAFHGLTVSERSDVILSTDHPATDYDAVLYLRSSCLDTETQLGCAATGPLGDGLLVRDVPPGVYFVIVDGLAGMAGSYELSVSLRPVRETGQPCDPTGAADRCEDGTECLDQGGAPACLDPFTLACMASTAATPGTTVTGTVGAGDDLQPTCGAGGTEAIHHVDLAAPGFLHAVETGGGLAPGSALYLRGPASCNPDDDLGCDTADGGLSVLTGPLAAGRYYLVVDGSGGYQIALSAGENLGSGATCDPASTTQRCGAGLYCLSGTCQAVTFVTDASPNASFCDAQGPLTGDFVVDGELTSGGATDLDTFELELAGPGVLHVETSDGLAGCAVDTEVLVFARGGATCTMLDFSTPTPIASDDDSGAGGICSSLTTASLAAGTYYVRVRRGGAGAGPYTLLVDLR